MDSFPRASPDFLPICIYSDGSCDHRDGISGYAAIVYDPNQGTMLYRGGVETGGSVRRAEMRGVLVGLQLALELCGLHDPKVQNGFRASGEPRRKISWFTDRDDLAPAVTPTTPGAPLYSRAKDADLWHHFAYYESWFDITAKQVPRNTVAQQTEADRVSGILRKMLQSRVESLQEESKIYLQ